MTLSAIGCKHEIDSRTTLISILMRDTPNASVSGFSPRFHDKNNCTAEGGFSRATH